MGRGLRACPHLPSLALTCPHLPWRAVPGGVQCQGACSARGRAVPGGGQYQGSVADGRRHLGDLQIGRRGLVRAQPPPYSGILDQMSGWRFGDLVSLQSGHLTSFAPGLMTRHKTSRHYLNTTGSSCKYTKLQVHGIDRDTFYTAQVKSYVCGMAGHTRTVSAKGMFYCLWVFGG